MQDLLLLNFLFFLLKKKNWKFSGNLKSSKHGSLVVLESNFILLTIPSTCKHMALIQGKVNDDYIDFFFFVRRRLYQLFKLTYVNLMIDQLK